jgi:choline dehydrogenase-like flavoprotein
MRGSRHDCDQWAELGAEGWSYQHVLPYFKKSQNMQDQQLRKSGEFIHRASKSKVKVFSAMHYLTSNEDKDLDLRLIGPVVHPSR